MMSGLILSLIFVDEIPAAMPTLTNVFLGSLRVVQGLHCSRGLSATIGFRKVGIPNLSLIRKVVSKRPESFHGILTDSLPFQM
jgi:hypothetical protein